MAFTAIIMVLALCTNIRLTSSEETNLNEKSHAEMISALTEAQLSNSTGELAPENRRNARQLNIDKQEYVLKPAKTKRQVIKIPANVSKVKVIPQPVPTIRFHNRVRQQFKPQKFPPHIRGHPSKRFNSKRPEFEYEDYESEEVDYYPQKKPKRHSKKPKIVIKDVSPQEFYDDIDDYQNLASNNVGFVHKNPKRPNHPNNKYGKKPRKPQHPQHPQHPKHQDEEHETYEHDYDDKPTKRPTFEEESGYEIVKPGQKFRDQKHHHYQHQYNSEPARPYFEHDYEHSPFPYEDFAASNIHMKQVPAPNLSGLNVVQPPDLGGKESHTVKKAKPEANEVQYSMKKIPTTRQIQSLFPQQYTTHNPHVQHNFGLSEADGHKVSSSYSFRHEGGYADTHPFEFGAGVGKINQPAAAASEHHVTSVPAAGSGIHVVQPPHFGDGSIHKPAPTAPYAPQSSPGTNNQRATIRDILLQDCPESEVSGYCSSPPRYPTQQIHTILKKCADIMEAMYSPAPPEPVDDLSYLTKRSDPDVEDIIDIEDITNGNITSDESRTREVFSSWSRSGSEGGTACSSDLTIVEPGYAREITSGRWFVIVQTTDTTVQKITTDTCVNIGKPCGGLVGLKCSRAPGARHGIKSTHCIQRYTHQRLVSWDPEAPHKCPRIRVFRFPTACVCHLGLV